jgi:glutamate 5-kinase
MGARKRFLAFFAEHAGELVVDRGAARALLGQGRSLLPRGIVKVRGKFARGDIVRILDPEGVGIAKGVCNYSANEVENIRGRRTAEIQAILDCDAYDDEVVHRNNMVLTC